MENIQIAETKGKFGIHFDFNNALLEFRGRSYPDNALEFFDPLIRWATALVESSPDVVIINFHVTYYNTSTSKYLLKLLEIFDQYRKSGGEVRLTWFCYEDEEELLDSWQNLMTEVDLSCQIQLVPSAL